MKQRKSTLEIQKNLNLLNDERNNFEKQNEEAEKQQNMLKNNGKSKGDISRPNIAPKQPTYTTKAPRK